MDLEIKCDKCGRVFYKARPDFDGVFCFICPMCGHEHTVIINADGSIANSGDNAGEARDAGGVKPDTQPAGYVSFSGKSVALREGVNVIGRKDPVTPSDIEIDDKFASRRSIEIKATKAGKGHEYSLRILKAANSVEVDGRTLDEGDTIPLQNGATILLGYTRLTLEKA